MSTVIRAEERLRNRGEITPARRAGVIFRPSDEVPFLKNLESELNPILYEGEGATKTAFQIVDDAHQMRWVVLEDGRFDDLVSSAYTVGNAMRANGGASNLLAAVFQMYFTGSVEDNTYRSGLRTYWIYRYDRQAFYPFVPTGEKEGERDRPTEMRLGNLLRREGMVVERSLEEWLGLWGIPF